MLWQEDWHSTLTSGLALCVATKTYTMLWQKDTLCFDTTTDAVPWCEKTRCLLSHEDWNAAVTHLMLMAAGLFWGRSSPWHHRWPWDCLTASAQQRRWWRTRSCTKTPRTAASSTLRWAGTVMNKFGYGGGGGVYVVEEEPPTVQGSLNGRFFNGKVGGHCDLGTGDAYVVVVVEEETPTVPDSQHGHFFNFKVGGHCDE